MVALPFISRIAEEDHGAYCVSVPAKPLLNIAVCGAEAATQSALVTALAGSAAKNLSACRYFETENRRLLVRPVGDGGVFSDAAFEVMASADAAVLIVDAHNGVLPHMRRDAFLLSSFGVKRIALAVNTLDLKGYKEAAFDRIRRDFGVLCHDLDFDAVTALPVSAVTDGNISTAADAVPWYKGLSLRAYFDGLTADPSGEENPLRMIVEDVPPGGATGRIVSGTLRTGDKVKLLPSVRESTVSALAADGQALSETGTGQRITVTLAGKVTVSPGEVISAAAHPCEISDQFRATLFWTGDEPLLPGRTYLMQTGAATAEATIAQPRHAIDIDTLEERAARTLEQGETGVCHLNLNRRIAFDPFSENRETGRFTIIDSLTKEVVGSGIIDFALRRAANIHMQALDIDKAARAGLKGQRPAILWFTGLSGSGKSTIANALEKKLHAMGRHTAILDGDNVRHGLNQDLGFTDADRVENIRRVSEVGRLMVDAGLIVLVSFISPFRSERKMARRMVADGEFVEIHVDTPLQVAEARDVKGLYAKARAGEIRNFTGIDSPYETPENPEIRLATTDQSPEEAAEDLLQFLQNNGYIG